MTSWPLPPTPGGEHTTLGDLMGISVSLMPRLAAGGGGGTPGKAAQARDTSAPDL